MFQRMFKGPRAEEGEEEMLSSSLQSLSLRGRDLFASEMAKGSFGHQQKRKRPHHADEINTSDDDSLLSEEELPKEIYDGDQEGKDVGLDTIPGQKGDQKKGRGAWTEEQDEALKTAVEKYEGKNWKAIAREVPGNRTHIQCLQRWGKVLRPGLVKGPWTEEEDDLLRTFVPIEPKGNWVAVAAHVPGRTAKQCRERWSLCLDPSIRKDPWTAEEDDILLHLHDKYGNAWALIAKQLPGRTENATKSRFKSIERKKDRAWSASEDATIIRGKAEEKKWGAITAMLPVANGRSKHAVKMRWKVLVEGDPSLKRFDSGGFSPESSNPVAMQLPIPSSQPSYSGKGLYAFPQSYMQLSAVPPPIPMDQTSPPRHDPPTNNLEAADENGSSYSKTLLASLSSDKLRNFSFQDTEPFDDWIAKTSIGQRVGESSFGPVPPMMMMPNGSFGEADDGLAGFTFGSNEDVVDDLDLV